MLPRRGALNLWGTVSPGRKQLRLPGTAPRRDAVAREPSRSTNGTFPPRPPSCWVRASCSCSVALAADPACGTARHSRDGLRPSLGLPPRPNPSVAQVRPQTEIRGAQRWGHAQIFQLLISKCPLAS